MRNVISGLLTRSLENPRTPLSNPAEWLIEGLGGGPSTSGMTINRKTALTYSPFWRGVTLISTDIGKLPLTLFRRLPGGGKERAVEHPAYRLARWKPHPLITAFYFRQTITSHVLIKGNGYAFIVRAGNGDPTELIVLDPDVTFPVRERETGVVSYVTTVNGEMRKMAFENVLHIKGLGFDGLQGYSVVEFAKDSLGLGMGAQKYGAVYFRNNARPNVVLEHPGTLKPEARELLRKSWEHMHQGLDNQHRVAVLWQGMKANVLSTEPKKSQLVETRKHEIIETANWFGVPAHKLGDTTSTSFASLQEENQSYLDDALEGRLINWESEFRGKLLTEEQKENDTHFFEFNRRALVKANLSERFEGYTKALAAGWMSRDEVRDAENMNPIPDGTGGEFLVPLTMGPSGGEDDDNEDDNDADGGADEDQDRQRSLGAHRRLLQDVLARMVRRVGIQAKKTTKHPKAFFRWVEDDLSDDNRSVFVEAVGPAMAAIACVFCDTTQSVESLADTYFDVVRSNLLAACECQASELVASVERSLAAMEETIPETLAELVVSCKREYQTV